MSEMRNLTGIGHRTKKICIIGGIEVYSILESRHYIFKTKNLVAPVDSIFIEYPGASE